MLDKYKKWIEQAEDLAGVDVLREERGREEEEKEEGGPNLDGRPHADEVSSSSSGNNS